MRPAAAAGAPAGSDQSHAPPASLPPVGARPLSKSQRTLTPSRSAPQRAPAGDLITNAREKRAALKAELAELERQDAAASQPETASTLESRLPRALCAAATPTAQAGVAAPQLQSALDADALRPSLSQSLEPLPRGWVAEEEPASGLPRYRHLVTGEVRYDRPRGTDCTRMTASEKARHWADEGVADDTPPEPPLRCAADVPAWQQWAKARALEHEARVHLRAPDGGLLRVFSTTDAQISSAFGIGARLYFELLRFCALICLIGLFASAPSLMYNLATPENGSYEIHSSEVGAAMPSALFVFTTAGARLGCTTSECRTVTLISAVFELLFIGALIGAIRHMRAHSRAAALHHDQMRCTISDFSVELFGLPHDATAAQVRELLHSKLRLYAQQRINELTARELRARRLRGSERHAVALRALAFWRQFLAAEHWRVFDVQLLLNDGDALLAGLQKYPLERRLEQAIKLAEREALLDAEQTARSNRAGLGWLSAWRGARDARLARRVKALEEKLRAARDRVESRASGATVTLGAIATFEFEEGRLACEKVFEPWRWVPLRLRRRLRLDSGAYCLFSAGAMWPVEARPVPEPPELILHNIVHRGSLRKALRRLAAFLLVMGFLVLTFSSVFAAQERRRRRRRRRPPPPPPPTAAASGTHPARAAQAVSQYASEISATNGTLCDEIGAAWDADANASAAACGTDESWLLPYDGPADAAAEYERALLRTLPADNWESPCDACAESYDVCRGCYCGSMSRLYWDHSDEAREGVGESAWLLGGPSSAAVWEMCHTQIWAGALSTLVAFLASFVILIVNSGLRMVIYRLGHFELHDSFTSLTREQAAKLWVYTYANAGVIWLVVGGGLPGWLSGDALCWGDRETAAPSDVVCLAGEGGILFRGGYRGYSFTSEWYLRVGAKLLWTMFLMWLSPLYPVFARGLHLLRRRRLFPSRVTLAGVLELHTGPPFPFATRYGQVYAYMALVLTYGAPMPIAYALGVGFFTSVYHVDKWAMLRHYRLPERAVDHSLLLSSLEWFKYLLILHAAFAFWAFRSLPDAEEVDASDTATELRRFFAGWTPFGGLAASLSVSSLMLLAALVLLVLFAVASCLRNPRRALEAEPLARRPQREPPSSRRSSKVAPLAAEVAVSAEQARLASLSTELGELEGLPSLVDALNGALHPTLRRVTASASTGGAEVVGADAAVAAEVVHISSVDARADDWLPWWLHPYRLLFEAVGIVEVRASTTWDEWLGGARVRVHITGDGCRSYAADEHPAYRNAFKGSEEVAARRRERVSVRCSAAGAPAARAPRRADDRSSALASLSEETEDEARPSGSAELRASAETSGFSVDMASPEASEQPLRPTYGVTIANKSGRLTELPTRSAAASRDVSSAASSGTAAV